MPFRLRLSLTGRYYISGLKSSKFLYRPIRRKSSNIKLFNIVTLIAIDSRATVTKINIYILLLYGETLK